MRLPTTPLQGRRERLLGTDHVGVQPGDERPGLCPGEEGEDCRWTWSKTCVRRSKISPSPMRDEIPAPHQAQSPRQERPSSATISAITVTTCGSPVDAVVDQPREHQRLGDAEQGHEDQGDEEVPMIRVLYARA